MGAADKGAVPLANKWPWTQGSGPPPAAGEHSGGGARTGFPVQWREQPTKEMIPRVTDGEFDRALSHFISKL